METKNTTYDFFSGLKLDTPDDIAELVDTVSVAISILAASLKDAAAKLDTSEVVAEGVKVIKQTLGPILAAIGEADTRNREASTLATARLVNKVVEQTGLSNSEAMEITMAHLDISTQHWRRVADSVKSGLDTDLNRKRDRKKVTG